MPLLPAAIAIVLNSDHTEVLLVKRRDVPVWILPGGGIEHNETAEEAVIRETFEETGYQVTIVRQCADYRPINRLASTTAVFICQVCRGHPQLSDETTAIAFFPLSQLPKHFFHIHDIWLKEALNHSTCVQRPLYEVSYSALMKYALRHPREVLRYAWTRLVKT